MDQKQLLAEISKTLSKVKAVKLAELAITTDFIMADLLALCYHSEKSVAFRAAWILEFIEHRYPERFMPVLEDFLTMLPQQKNASCQRHFSKILMAITNSNAKNPYKEAFHQLPLHARDELVERMFEWLIERTTPVAVRVNCMDVLFNMISFYPWIGEELTAQIELFMKEGSAAMQSRGKKLLYKIRKC